MAATRMVINAWLRAGNTEAISNIEGFLEEAMEILSKIKIGLVRADSGFYADKFLKYFKRREINCIVSVKLYKPIRHIIEGLSGWINLKNRIQIKELKYDFTIDGFCMKDFWATESAFRMVLVAYNLMSLFRQVVLQDKRHSTLKTIKFKWFGLGSQIVKSSREKVLEKSTAVRKRQWIEGLFSKVNDLSLPFSFSNA